MFRFDKLTQKAQEAMQQAQAIAEQVRRPGDVSAAPAGCPRAKRGRHRPPAAGKMRRAAGRHRGRSAPPARRICPRPPAPSRASTFRSRSTRCSSAPSTKPRRFKDEFVSTEHLLLSLAEQRSDPAGQLLERAGATHDALLHALVSVRGTQRVTDQNPETSTRHSSATPTI